MSPQGAKICFGFFHMISLFWISRWKPIILLTLGETVRLVKITKTETVQLFETHEESKLSSLNTHSLSCSVCLSSNADFILPYGHIATCYGVFSLNASPRLPSNGHFTYSKFLKCIFFTLTEMEFALEIAKNQVF